MPDKPFHTIHDRFFKGMFEDRKRALAFLQHHLPLKVTKEINWRRLSLVKGDFLTRKLKKLETDVLYVAQYHRKKGSIYFLLEAQSDVNEKMALRMHEYAVHIKARHKRLHEKDDVPVVVPFVIYFSKKAWTAKRKLVDLHDEATDIAQQIAEQDDYYLIDACRWSEADFDKEPYSGLCLYTLSQRKTKDIGVFVDHLKQLIETTGLAGETDYVTMLHRYLAQVIPDAQEMIMEQLEYVYDPDKGFTSIADKYYLNGRNEGRDEGRNEGRLEGAELAMQNLAKKMLSQGYDNDFVASLCEFSLEQVEQLAADQTKIV